MLYISETANEDSDCTFYSFSEADDTLIQDENQSKSIQIQKSFHLDFIASSTPKNKKTILGAEISSILVLEDTANNTQVEVKPEIPDREVEIPQVVVVMEPSQNEDFKDGSNEKLSVEDGSTMKENSLIAFERIEKQTAEIATPIKDQPEEASKLPESEQEAGQSLASNDEIMKVSIENPVPQIIVGTPENESESNRKNEGIEKDLASSAQEQQSLGHNEREFVKKYRETIDKFPGIAEEEIKELTEDINIVDFPETTSTTVNPFVTKRATKKITFNETVKTVVEKLKMPEKKTGYNTRKSFLVPPPPLPRRSAIVVSASQRAGDRRKTLVKPQQQQQSKPEPIQKRKADNDEKDVAKKTKKPAMLPPVTAKVPHPKKPTQQFVCNYCDIKFEREIALHNHQIERCKKIPDKEKRLLLIKDYKKVETRIPHQIENQVPKSRKSIAPGQSNIVTRNQVSFL